MNLVKDKKIIELINRLNNKLENKFVINDYWNADLLAIGLSDINKKRLIYIAIKKGNRYYLSKEKIESPETIQEYIDIDIEEIIKITKKYFEII